MEDVDVVENRHVYFSGGSSRPPFPLLIFRPNWGPKRISKGLDDRPHPPPPLSKGLDDRAPHISRSGSGLRIRRCILLFPTFLLSEIPHSLSCLVSRRRPYFSFLSLTQIACRLVGFVDERTGNEIVFQLFFLFLYIFYWFHISSLDICFIPFTFGTSVLIGTFVNM